MARYPEFMRKLTAWRKAVVHQIDIDPTSSFTRLQLEHWQKDSDGYFRKGDSLYWDFRKLEQMHNLPEWADLESAANNYPDIKKHLNTLVGSPYSRQRLELRNIAEAMLPRPVFSSDGQQVNLVYKGLAKKYRDFEEFIAKDNLQVTTMWPIGGIRLGKSINIKKGVVMRQLNELELITALNGGLIRPMFPDTPIMAEHEQNYSGLFYTYELPKIIGEDNQPDDIVSNLEKEKATLLENITTVAAVVDIRGIRFNGRTELMNGWPMGLNSYSWSGNVASNNSAIAVSVEPKTVNAFKKTWGLLFGHGGSVDKSLYLTARRLAFAEERVRTDDTLLDLMIAAEALYLGSDSAQDRGELKYRLSLRASYWAETSKLDATRKQLFTLMKDAYDIRSTIAHGGTPKPRKLQYKGQQLPQADFNGVVEKVVRLGLQKAIKLTAKTRDKKFRPEWDDAVIAKLAR